MAHYQAMGSIPPKRHTQHRRPARRGKVGELYYEELMGEEGFSSDSSLLYHRNIPSTVAGYHEWTVGDLGTTANHPLLPRHLTPHDLFPSKVVLSDQFFREIAQHAVPLDVAALKELRGSPLRLDCYAWLPYRMYGLSRPPPVSWEAIQGQFGSGFAPTPQGRARVESW